MQVPNYWKDFIEKHTKIVIDLNSEKSVQNKSLNYLLTTPVYPLIYGKSDDKQFLAVGDKGLYTLTDNPHKDYVTYQTPKEIVEKVQHLFSDAKWDFLFYEEKKEVTSNIPRDLIKEIVKELEGGTCNSEKIKSMMNLAVRKKITIEEIEQEIAKNPKASVNYACNIIATRFPEGEKLISQDASLAFEYLTKHISKRWPEAEPAIAKDKFIAISYIQYYSKYKIERFKLAEPTLFKDDTSREKYIGMMFDFYVRNTNIKISDLDELFELTINKLSRKMIKSFLKESVLQNDEALHALLLKYIKKEKLLPEEDSILLFLVELRKPELVEIALKLGYKHESAMKIAVENNDKKIIELLKKYE
jgi:hypothetical protein